MWRIHDRDDDTYRKPDSENTSALLFKYSIIPADETRVAAEKRLSGRDAPTETGREDAQSLSSVG